MSNEETLRSYEARVQEYIDGEFRGEFRGHNT